MKLERSYEVILCPGPSRMDGLEEESILELAREPGFIALLFHLTVALVKSFNVS